MKSGQWSVVGGQWSVVSGQWSVAEGQSMTSVFPPSALRLPPSALRLPPSPRRAFTLVELLVTIAIIGIMASMVLGVLQVAQEAGKTAATKSTIVKLNSIIMQRYESYMTRRAPVQLAACPGAKSDGTPFTAAEKIEWAKTNQRKRLDAIRDLMRMEMPDAVSDITSGPYDKFTANGAAWTVPEPALHKLYAANPPTAPNSPAQCLYLIVSKGSPEAMEHFSQSEIGSTEDGKPCFVDGWGMPIMWLRWAPGYSKYTIEGETAKVNAGVFSELQTGLYKAATLADGTKLPDDHDPFDARRVDGLAFKMVPLIYSAGKDGKFGIELGTPAFNGNPYANTDLGKPQADGGSEDNITNHSTEGR